MNSGIHTLLYGSSLEAFVALCRHKSFTQAAKVLGLSQSSVSQSIQKLEQTLGVVLFDRQVRPIALTAQASLLLDMVQGQYADMEHTVSQMRQQKHLKSVVRLGVVESLSASLAPALIRLLCPQVQQISLVSGISPNMAQDLINKEVDIIITSDPLDGIDGLSRHFICREPYVLVLPKQFHSDGRTYTWLQLVNNDLPLVRYSRRSAAGRAAETHFSRLRLTVPVKVEADTSQLVLSMVADGLGWALSTPLCLLQCKHVLDKVDVSHTPTPGFSRDIYLVTRSNEYQEPVDAILAECAHQLSSIIIPDIKHRFAWACYAMQLNQPPTRI